MVANRTRGGRAGTAESGYPTLPNLPKMRGERRALGCRVRVRVRVGIRFLSRLNLSSSPILLTLISFERAASALFVAMESSGDAHGHGLRDDAIDVWRNWLVVVHKPRRLAIVKERDEHRKRISRANANLAAGHGFSLALRYDNNIACWGRNTNGQAPPDGIQGDFVAIAAGSYHSLALQRDGNIACWGDNDDGQAPTPEHDEEYGEDEYATLSAKFPFMTDVHILL